MPAMLSSKLIRLIEDHRNQLADAAVRRIRRDSELSHMGRLAESELCDWSLGILMVLETSRAGATREELSARHRGVGRRRFEEDIPLHEAIRCLQILKGTIIDFVRSEGLAQTALELYAEGELEREVGSLFDRLLYSLAYGYEEARRAATLRAAG